ncbi:MAG TPA: hypothetical protein VFY29_17395 [Terriglobia bacterium]|nr:hypothetical protein [Terriglobia bacterium]
MSRNTAYDFDNRNTEQMYEYLEARIEALKSRIAELEFENESLRVYQGSSEFAANRERRSSNPSSEMLN